MQWRPSQRAQLLAPFDHQVAGQSSMLVYDATTLCKPLIPREHFVYQTLPVELQEFTPQYRGEILVKLLETEGHIQLVGHAMGAADVQDQGYQCITDSEAHLSTQNCGSSCGGSSSCQGNSLSSDASQAQYGSSEASAAAHEGVDPCATSFSTMSSAASHLHPQTHSLNPWSMKNHKRLLEKMRKSSHRNDKTRFMLLGNVVAGFKKPCILDLKIGSRLHGDDASSTKVASQTGKCNRTTSSTLAVRLCGMQVYQVTSKKYVNLDKYHGRKLTAETLQETLKDFLHNGVHFRQELVEPIISRLAALIACVRRLNTYRFYASSLLIMYDGEVQEEPISISHLDMPDQSKNKLKTHQSEAKSFDLRSKVEDSISSNINPRPFKSPEQACKQYSKPSESLAASLPTNDVCNSTSTNSVPNHLNIYSTQEQQRVISSSSWPQITHNATASVRTQVLSSNLSCPDVFEQSLNLVKCFPEVAGDSLNMLKLPFSHQYGVSSIDNRDNCVPMTEDSVNPTFLKSSHKNLHNLPHSCQIPISQNIQDNGRSFYSTDGVEKGVESINVYGSDYSGHEDKGRILPGQKFSFQSDLPTDSGTNTSVIFQAPRFVGVSTISDSHTSPKGLHSHQSLHSGTKQFSDPTVFSKMVDLHSDLREPVGQKMDKSALSSSLTSEPLSICNASILCAERRNATSTLDDIKKSAVQTSLEKSSNEAEERALDNFLEGTLATRSHSGQARVQNLKVDVKMIDFAHTTHSGFESDKVRHSGPDEDYITGLENLKSLFELLCQR